MERICCCFGRGSCDESGQGAALAGSASEDHLQSTNSSSALPEGVHVVADDKLQEMLRGQRVLHVKGFGSGFNKPTEFDTETDAKQDKEALDALDAFSPDFMVVDGDPWGKGFQRHIKAYAAHQKQHKQKTPSLIWAKPVQMRSSDPEQEKNRLEQEGKFLGKAKEWAQECEIPVYIYWIDAKKLTAKIGSLFGADAWKTLTAAANKTTGARGRIKVLSEGKSNLSWMDGLEGSSAGEKLKQSIEACEKKETKGKPERGRGFEDFSFENSAKGNLIFELLPSTDPNGLHGVVSFGGGESVLLEFASKYLNSKSNFGDSAALFPHSRGVSEDPSFPHHVGKHFTRALT